MAGVIQVEKISKCYPIREAGEKLTHRSLREDVAAWVSGWTRARSGGPATEDCGRFWALRDVSFEVAEGERLGILGRNGAGKSTLLKILSRITRPTTGRVKVRGRVGSLLEVGTGFHPELSGRDNIQLSAAILGMTATEIKQRMDAIIAFSGVERFLDMPVKRYSSGMYVRLAFAVAAHVEPDILILDEVLAVGDVAFQQKCMGRIRELTGQGRTILLVSHNMNSFKGFCDRALLLDGGGVAFDGPVGEAVTAYHAVPSAGPARAREAMIHDIRTCWREGPTTAGPVPGEPLGVLVDLEVHVEVADAVIEVAVVSEHGEQLTVSVSMQAGGGPLHLSPGRYATEVDIDVALMPRGYQVRVGLYHADGTPIDTLTRALDLERIDPAGSDVDGPRWGKGRGYIRAPATWKVTRAA